MSRRSRVHRVARLKDDELRKNPALVDELVDVVLESFAPPSRETVARYVLFRDPGSQFVLFYARRGTLLGFCSHVVKKMRIDGRVQGVLDVGAYFRPETRGLGLRAAWDVTWDVIGFRLRHPTIPLCYVGAVTNPAAYRLMRRFNPNFFPRPEEPAPASVVATIRQSARQKGYRVVSEDDPWVVDIGATVRLQDEERLRRFVERTDDPDVRFYVERCPRYLEGQWLMAWAPLSLRILFERLVALARTLVVRRGRAPSG